MGSGIIVWTLRDFITDEDIKLDFKIAAVSKYGYG
jgi:hypothetical protein